MQHIIHIICGARPNFVKAAPLYISLLKTSEFIPKLIHTGQHYDRNMSDAFLENFDIKSPDYSLKIGRGSHVVQIAQTMIAYEKLLEQKKLPSLVVVIGDVNATLACSLVAKKKNLLVAHLEAGLRSGNLSMPEEINRKIVDYLADYHWIHSKSAKNNLLKEDISSKNIQLVGNILVDSYKMKSSEILKREYWKNLNLRRKNYILVTLHRPSLVDNFKMLTDTLKIFQDIDISIVFPIHPRIKNNFGNKIIFPKNVVPIDPLGYIDFMSLLEGSFSVITDSGGVQEESSFLNIPCFTLRSDTERPITISLGSNQLVNLSSLKEQLKNPKNSNVIPFWDGKTSQRIIKILYEILS